MVETSPKVAARLYPHTNKTQCCHGIVEAAIRSPRYTVAHTHRRQTGEGRNTSWRQQTIREKATHTSAFHWSSSVKYHRFIIWTAKRPSGVLGHTRSSQSLPTTEGKHLAIAVKYSSMFTCSWKERRALRVFSSML